MKIFSDSSFVPPLIYAVLGSSKHLAVGPVSIASLVMGTMLNDAVSYSLHPVLYLRLAFTATFFAGLFQASLGLLRYHLFHVTCTVQLKMSRFGSVMAYNRTAN
ncbi:putative SLC26A/SulP transporter [Helianthus annuus]|nr:putative SLC26A/SulP transporter [Helianthus annuus]KAJ0586539.1 putative SLC26A/SulP transporter [Helianthus annuus]KAJ0759722.1 putative SLC26A/SulP transporter [Helianthus annuus]